MAMSLPIAPRPTTNGGEVEPPSSPVSLQKSRKISTACGACKQRKTKCSGGQPCEACAARNSLCDYDASSDQRRKIANQRNVQDLAQAQHDLDHYRHLVGGVIAIFKAGSSQSANDFAHLVRNGADMSSLAAFVRNEVRSTEVLQRAFESIDFHIDGPSDLPSPTQLLKGMEAFTGSDSGSATNYNSNGSPSSYGVNGQMTNGY